MLSTRFAAGAFAIISYMTQHAIMLNADNRIDRQTQNRIKQVAPGLDETLQLTHPNSINNYNIIFIGRNDVYQPVQSLKVGTFNPGPGILEVSVPNGSTTDSITHAIINAISSNGSMREKSNQHDAYTTINIDFSSLHAELALSQTIAIQYPQLHKKLIQAVKYFCGQYNMQGEINILIYPYEDTYEPNDNIDGSSANNFVRIGLDPHGNTNYDIVFTTLCHELMHAARALNGYGYKTQKTYLDFCIEEGIATYVSVCTQHENNLFAGTFIDNIKSCTNEELAKYLTTIKPYLNRECNYSDDLYYKLLLTGDSQANIPTWACYKVGYYIVSKFIEQNEFNITKLPALARNLLTDSRL